MIQKLTLNEAVAKAHASVEKAYRCKPGERRWLVGAAPDSYGNATYRSEIHVLEGSPPKGYVLVLAEDGRGTVIALDSAEANASQMEL